MSGKTHKVEIGAFDTVHIEKLFGPTIYCDLRVRADGANACWIIERMRITNDTETSWEEVCRVDAQESIFGDMEKEK